MPTAASSLLARLRELAEQATPGPWLWREGVAAWGDVQKRSLISATARYKEYPGVPRSVIHLEPRHQGLQSDGEQGFYHGEAADLEWISSCDPQTVLRLLDVLEAAWQAVAASEESDPELLELFRGIGLQHS